MNKKAEINVWDKISHLAKEFFLKSPVESVNLSEISKKVNRPNKISDKLGNKIDKKAQDISDIEVLPEYSFILNAIIEKCPAMFVTGRAGTGKSTLIRYLVSHIKKCAVVAPTAIAAINIEGCTIHSFFAFPPRTLNPDEAFLPKKHMIPVIENLNVLIVDEISMVSPDIVDCMNNSLKKAKGNDLPFGGIPILFVGDLLQLPPVVSDNQVGVYYTHRYDSQYFYSAEVFKTAKLIPIELKKVFRQTDPIFIEALERIRTNSNQHQAVDFINKNCVKEILIENEYRLNLVPTNAVAKSINEEKLDEIDSEIITYDAIYDGQIEEGLTRRFPAPDKLKLKIGAKVIFVKNYKPMWLNGTLGEVVDLGEDSIKVKILESGNIVPVSRETWKKIKYRYNYEDRKIENEEIGSFKQFPLSLGWAITIHKAQGMTLGSVRIDLGRGAFCSGQTYVALSRCKSLSGITLERKITMADVKTDATVIEFYKALGFLGKEDSPS